MRSTVYNNQPANTTPKFASLFPAVQKDFTNDCVFNETMQENFNIYVSTYHSTAQRTYYLAMSKMGEPRRTHLPAGKELGKLAAYAKSLTSTVSETESNALLARLFGANHIRHGLKQLCDSGRALTELTRPPMQQRPECDTSATGAVAKTTPGGRNHKKPSKMRRPPGARVTKCAHEHCQRRRKHPHAKVPGAAPTVNQRPLKPGLAVTAGRPAKANAKKTHPNAKKGHRRKKAPTVATTTASPSTTPEATFAAVAAADEESTESPSNASTEPSDEDDDQWDQSSAPSTGITAFVDDAADDESDS